jgi:hypothetical protein
LLGWRALSISLALQDPASPRSNEQLFHRQQHFSLFLGFSTDENPEERQDLPEKK